jgi:hypothetical protein
MLFFLASRFTSGDLHDALVTLLGLAFIVCLTLSNYVCLMTASVFS